MKLRPLNIKVICRKCDQEMLSESTSDNNTINIYLCSRCKYEVKVISIGNKVMPVGNKYVGATAVCKKK